MKQKTFILIAAAVATLGIAACEREEEPSGSPSVRGDTVPTVDTIPVVDTIPSDTVETDNPLVGTSWFKHFEQIMYGIRVVSDDRITFSSASEGFWETGGETTYDPWWDTTFAITYTYNPADHRVSVITNFFEYDPVVFVYHPDENQLINEGGDVFTPAEENQ